MVSTPSSQSMKKELTETIKEFETSKSEYVSLKESYEAQQVVSGDNKITLASIKVADFLLDII